MTVNHRAHPGAIFFTLLFWIYSCSNPPNNDASTPSDAVDTVVIRDIVDSQVVDSTLPHSGVRPLYAPCTSNAECGTGRRCATEYPGGMCTRRCTRDGDCGEGVCAVETCRPRCTLGGLECAATQLCDFFDSSNRDARACYPACYQTPPPGSPSCVPGYQCDPYLLGGQCTRFELRADAGLNGDACMVDEDCNGYCLQEIQGDTRSPWVNGSCYSLGRVPPADEYGPRLPLPRGNCPEGSVALQRDNLADEGDVAVCFRECRLDSECRPGYGCTFYRFASGATTTGYCGPIDCGAAPYRTMPNNGCPARMTCTIVAGQMERDCLRNTADPDAGTDAGTDTNADSSIGDAGDDVADAAMVD